MTSTVVTAAALFSGALGMVGCATDVPSREELVAAFEASGLPAEQAGCVTDAVLDHLPDEDIVRLMERGAGAGPRDDPNPARRPLRPDPGGPHGVLGGGRVGHQHVDDDHCRRPRHHRNSNLRTFHRADLLMP